MRDGDDSQGINLYFLFYAWGVWREANVLHSPAISRRPTKRWMYAFLRRTVCQTTPKWFLTRHWRVKMEAASDGTVWFVVLAREFTSKCSHFHSHVSFADSRVLTSWDGLSAIAHRSCTYWLQKLSYQCRSWVGACWYHRCSSLPTCACVNV